jgi:site-specific recombinase XerD
MAQRPITKTDIRDFRLDLKAENRSPHTIACYHEGATQYLASSGGEVSRAAVRQYLAQLADAGKSSATIGTRLTAIRVFFGWLEREGLIAEDPSRNLKLPRGKAVPVKPLSPAEIRRLIDSCKSPRDRAIVALLAATGMRVNELATITTDNLNLDRQEVRVLGKGSRWRYVPFDAQAARELARYERKRRQSRFEKNPALWLGERGPVTVHAVANVIRRAGAAAGIEHVYPHLLRHTFANHWLERGGSEQALMQICGWTNRSMMDRYSAHGAADRAAAEYHKLRR